MAAQAATAETVPPPTLECAAALDQVLRLHGAVIVAIQNTNDVGIDFLAWDVEVPLVAVILAAAVAGVLFDEILGFFWRRRRRHDLAERAELRRLRGR